MKKVRSEILRMGSIVEADARSYPSFGPRSVEERQVDIVDGKYRYRYQERGEIISEFVTDDFDIISYHLMQLIVAPIASSGEVKHRIEGEDPRRQRFRREEDLLGRLHPHWAERKRMEHEATLQRSPFDDSLFTKPRGT